MVENEMVERVARAIVPALGMTIAFSEPHVSDTPTIRRTREADTAKALEIARAAIEAMIEPTEAMLKASYKIDGYRTDGPDHKDVWQAMLFAAIP